jgi:hypothetical protein
MKWFAADVRADPTPGNCARAGALLAGFVGLIVGLVVGLHVYVATAWAAMLEVSIPAAGVGGIAGFLVGCALAFRGRFQRS